jgi:hypothetical protein
MGDHLQADIPIADMIAEASSKWDLYHLLVETGTSTSHPNIEATWRGLLPEGHVIKLRDPKNVAEIVALVVGLGERRIQNAAADLTQLGKDADSIREVLTALAPLAHTRGIRLSE